MTPERLIEVTIGLFDDTDVPKGKVPPVLAAAIMDALTEAGYWVVPLVGLTPAWAALGLDQPDGN